MSYSLRQSTKNTVEGLAINIDGETLSGSGVSKTFTWPGNAQGVKITGKNLIFPSWDGLWGVFRFMSSVKKQEAGGTTELLLPLEVGGQPVKNPDGTPVVIRYEVQMSDSVPQPSRFAVPRCVGEVAKK